jgi:biofilm PGA synthesis N-glycosyltransferase PgaC
MTGEMQRSCAVITPTRNEAANLELLARSLESQTTLPTAWVIVDNGSTDDTLAVAHHLQKTMPWLSVLTVPGTTKPVRGAPIVRSLHAGIAKLEAYARPDFVVSIDADVSFAPDYFDRLLCEFASDPALGIASGSCYELDKGLWRQRHVTGSTVWGATRMYRWACLQEVLPFEERFAWDGIDEIKANARGWRTKAFVEIPFRHHRPEGVRDGGRFRARTAQGAAAHYMGYRPWYLALRALRHMPRDPAAIGLVWGYARSALAREDRCADESARAYLRCQQSLRRLPLRWRESVARRRMLSP